jgi:hypothetical protein
MSGELNDLLPINQKKMRRTKEELLTNWRMKSGQESLFCVLREEKSKSKEMLLITDFLVCK